MPLTFIENLFKDPQTYFFLLLALVFWVFIERRVRASVDTEFAKRLASHRHELEMVADATRHDLQRQASEFGLFVQKKHAAIADVFHALSKAHGAATGLFGFSQAPTFEEFDTDDIKVFMDERKIPSGQQTSVLELWAQSKNRAVDDVLRPYLRLQEIGEAERTLQDAINLKLLNEIYLSDAILACADHLTSSLHKFIFDARHPPIKGSKPTQPAMSDVKKELHDLRSECRDELGYRVEPDDEN